MAAVAWSHTMPIWMALLGSGASLHHSPVCTLCKMVGSKGSMGLVSLVLLPWKAMYCSGGLPPVPLLA